MTTIVATPAEICSDSKGSGEGVSFGCEKVFRVGEVLVGMAGTLDAFESGLLWVKEGCDPDKAPKCIKKLDIIIVDGRTIRVHEGSPLGYNVTSGFYAIGSGSQGAMVASQFTSNLKDIVRAVAKIDPNTGGRIVSRRIKAK